MEGSGKWGWFVQFSGGEEAEGGYDHVLGGGGRGGVAEAAAEESAGHLFALGRIRGSGGSRRSPEPKKAGCLSEPELRHRGEG